LRNKQPLRSKEWAAVVEEQGEGNC
jgi:hypothetical protein